MTTEYEAYHCLLCYPTSQYNNDYVWNGWIYFRVSDPSDCSRQLSFLFTIPDNPPASNSGAVYAVCPSGTCDTTLYSLGTDYAQAGSCSLDLYDFYGTTGYDASSYG